MRGLGILSLAQLALMVQGTVEKSDCLYWMKLQKRLREDLKNKCVSLSAR